MGVFRRIVQGLYLAGGFMLVLFIFESAFPGTLGPLAFSPIAIISAFSMMALDSMFSLR